MDVFDKDHCVCKTEEGKVLEGIMLSYIDLALWGWGYYYYYV